MKKKHYPGINKFTLCGHEATRQEYDSMLKELINFEKENKTNLHTKSCLCKC